MSIMTQETTMTQQTDPLQAQADAYQAGYQAYMDGKCLESCTDEDMRLGWRYARYGEMCASMAETAAVIGADQDVALNLARYAWGDPPSIEDDCTPGVHPLPW